MAKKALLMILDGWGIGAHGKGDVIFNTPTPNLDKINQTYLTASSWQAVRTLVCLTDKWVTPR